MRVGDTHRMTPGKILFREGDPVTAVYRVVSGRVGVSARDGAGGLEFRYHVEAGEYLIEDVFDDTHSVQACCTLAGQIERIPVRSFHRLVERDRDFTRTLFRALTADIAELRQARELCRRHVGTARERILAYFASHADPVSGELELPCTQCVWARELGIAGETLSRILRKLIAEEVLERTGHRNFRLLHRG